jgi:osmotically inducible protein OsmC
MPTRSATATWNGGLKTGSGSYSIPNGMSAPYTWASRFQNETGSNPEELLAAAHAACYSMALSAALEKNETPGTTVKTSAKCSLEIVDGKPTITTMQLDVEAKVPKIDDATFQKLAADTKDGCPVSRALKGVNIKLSAKLA